MPSSIARPLRVTKSWRLRRGRRGGSRRLANTRRRRWTPRSSDRLAAVVKNPKATEALGQIQMTEADFRELVWLKSEVEHAEHDARMMITENISRVAQP